MSVEGRKQPWSDGLRRSNVVEICRGTAGSVWSAMQSAGDSERVDVSGDALILFYPCLFLKCRQIRAHCLFMPLSKPAACMHQNVRGDRPRGRCTFVGGGFRAAVIKG